tara:strand:- start:1318 stop:1947 length:630 start_codon:yes stop_codon:yes gene_type:complete
MSLTDDQLRTLGQKMSFPIAAVIFKDETPKTLEYNKAYIINLEDELDEEGKRNTGSHWTCLQINKYPNGLKEGIYFDPYGQPPPQDVEKSAEKALGGKKIPYNSKDVQSLMNNACGWYCAAFLYFINSHYGRSKDLYSDVGHFLSYFDDLNKAVDFKKNEYILKNFFRAEKKELRIPIDVETITTDDTAGGMDMQKLPASINLMKKKVA